MSMRKYIDHDANCACRGVIVTAPDPKAVPRVSKPNPGCHGCALACVRDEELVPQLTVLLVRAWSPDRLPNLYRTTRDETTWSITMRVRSADDRCCKSRSGFVAKSAADQPT